MKNILIIVAYPKVESFSLAMAEITKVLGLAQPTVNGIIRRTEMDL